VIKYLVHITWFAAIAAILLQDYTTMKIMPNAIIIHRYLFKPLTLERRNIEEIQVQNYFHYKIRWLWYIFILAFTGYLVYNAYHDILNYRNYQAPLEIIFNVVLSKFMMILYFLALCFNLMIRIMNTKVLKVDVDERKFKFYFNDPDELKKYSRIK
jgi:hypothetical protein